MIGIYTYWLLLYIIYTPAACIVVYNGYNIFDIYIFCHYIPSKERIIIIQQLNNYDQNKLDLIGGGRKKTHKFIVKRISAFHAM